MIGDKHVIFEEYLNNLTMTIEERKSSLISHFKSLKSEELIIKLEHLIKDLKKIEYERNLKPLSIEEFNHMIDRALEDHKPGNVIAHDDLINEVKNW